MIPRTFDLGGVKLAARRQIVDHGGDEMVVAPTAQKADPLVRSLVPRQRRRYLRGELQLGKRGGHIKSALESNKG